MFDEVLLEEGYAHMATFPPNVRTWTAYLKPRGRRERRTVGFGDSPPGSQNETVPRHQSRVLPFLQAADLAKAVHGLLRVSLYSARTFASGPGVAGLLVRVLNSSICSSIGSK